jgi:hypothetical protein
VTHVNLNDGTVEGLEHRKPPPAGLLRAVPPGVRARARTIPRYFREICTFDGAPLRSPAQDHHNIEIRGFGTFKVRERKSRLARNPRTGDPVEVPPRAVPVFKPSKELRAMVEEKPLEV